MSLCIFLLRFLRIGSSHVELPHLSDLLSPRDCFHSYHGVILCRPPFTASVLPSCQSKLFSHRCSTAVLRTIPLLFAFVIPRLRERCLFHSHLNFQTGTPQLFCFSSSGCSVSSGKCCLMKILPPILVLALKHVRYQGISIDEDPQNRETPQDQRTIKADSGGNPVLFLIWSLRKNRKFHRKAHGGTAGPYRRVKAIHHFLPSSSTSRGGATVDLFHLGGQVNN